MSPHQRARILGGIAAKPGPLDPEDYLLLAILLPEDLLHHVLADAGAEQDRDVCAEHPRPSG